MFKRSGFLAALTAFTMLIAPIVSVTTSSSIARADSIVLALEVSGGGGVLAGDDSTVTLTARNTGPADLFNLSFSVDVPVGVVFVSSALGAPLVYTEPITAPGTVRWVWQDAADLPISAEFDFAVTMHAAQPVPASPWYTADPVTFPVASSFVVDSIAYASTDARYLPVFTGSTGVGGAAAIAATEATDPVPVTTRIIPLTISKSEPSPESELLRGAHDQTTDYTLTIENNKGFQTSGAVVVDYVPAGLEFLGCGTVDNGVDQEEYSGSASLTGTPALAALGAFPAVANPTRQGCQLPDSVETIAVTGPASGTELPGRLPAGIYTKVTWSIGDLPAGSRTLLQYAVAVPLYENTLSWADATPAATPDVGHPLAPQAANLDNNNGPSTRHGDAGEHAYSTDAAERAQDDGDAWTNRARVDGNFDGMVRADDATAAASKRGVFDEADHTIGAMDLAIVKSVTTSKGSGGDFRFVPDEAARFTLLLRSGEYTSSHGVVIRDTVRNGLCPLVPAGTPTSVVGAGSYPAECAPGQGTSAAQFMPISGATVTSVEYDSTNGRFTMVLAPLFAGVDSSTIATNTTHTISYPVLMRSSYELAAEFGPTTSGDTFLNTADLSATTTLRTEVAAIDGQLGDQDVWDDSGATIGSDFTTIAEQILPRGDVDATSTPCATASDTDWVDGKSVTPTGFRMGDTVCYRLVVDFPGITTRNPVIADFLPVGVSYVGSAVATASTTTADLDTSAAADGRLQWVAGTAGVGGDRYVAPGAVLQLLVWGTITAPAVTAGADKLDNLMKYRQENVKGTVYYLRDNASFEREPGITLTKGVMAIDGTVVPASGSALAGDQFGSNRDHIQVRESDTIMYRIDLTGLSDEVTGVEIWDALPVGIGCDDLSGPFTENGEGMLVDPTCSTVATGLRPSSLNGRDVIRWTDVTIPAGGTMTLIYLVIIPTGTSVETSLDNTASVVSMHSGANGGSSLIYYPEDSLDATATANYPGENLVDSSNVYLPQVSVTKTATSTVDTANSASQAVVGELIEYTYSVTVPAYTTVFNGSLSDSLPANLQFFSGFAPIATLDGGALPGGFSVNAANGTLSFPAAWSPGAESHIFAVTIQAYPTDVAANAQGAVRTNTATFTSTKTADVASGTYSHSVNSSVTIIAPAPTVDKVVSTVSGATPVFNGDRAVVLAGSVVGFSLTVTNPGDRPTSYDTVVTDCVPAELSGIASISSGGALDGSCAAGETKLTWPASDIAPGDTVVFTYTATVTPDAAGLALYTNTAALTGYSLPATTATGVRASVTDTDDAKVELSGATLKKSASRSTATIGDSVAYTLEVMLPANVNFYDTVLKDTVPKGVKVVSSSVTDAQGLTITGPAPSTTTGTAATVLTWLLSDGVGGDIHDTPSQRIVKITYDAIIVDSRVDHGVGSPTPIANNTVRNTAAFTWNVVDATESTRASSGDKTATVRVWEPSLSIVKKVNAADAIDVRPGAAAFTYTVTVRDGNTSTTSTAYDVTVHDAIPAGVIVDGATINVPAVPGVTFTTVKDGGVITAIDWTIASIAKNASVALAYQATLTTSDHVSDGETFTNTASITGYHSLPAPDVTGERRDYTGGTDSAVVAAVFPSLTVVKTPGAGPAYIGIAHPFTVAISNPGGATAKHVEVVDTLPTGWSYVSGTAKLGGTSIADPTAAGQVLTWTDLGDIAAAGSMALTYSAMPDAGHAWGAGNTGSTVQHTNAVTVTAEDESGLPGNATRTYEGSTDADVAIQRADLAIAKSHTGRAIAGAAFTWTLAVSNLGPDAAVGPIVVKDTLPSGVSFVSASGTGWTVTGPVAGEYTFTHPGPVAASGSLPAISLVVSVPSTTAAGTTIVNTASVSGATFETVTGNNSDNDSVTVETESDLGLVKDVTGTEFIAGQDVTWSIGVTNHGPSVARGPITVTDTLPTGIGAAIAAGTDWACAPPASGTIECVYSGDLAVGASAPDITVTTSVLSATLGALYNSATVVGTTAEPTPDPHSNTDSASINSVGSEADLVLEKSIVSSELSAGGFGRYRVEVRNDGPSDALNVTVRDDLPAGVTFVAGTVTSDPDLGWTCADTSATQLDCTLAGNLGTLVDGESTWFEFGVALASNVHGTVVNSATTASTTTDPDVTNNVDVAIAIADLSTDVSIDKQTTATIVEGGDSYDYTLQVSNDGVADVANVVVTDDVPSELVVTGVTLATASATDPGWVDPCIVSGQAGDGSGGTVECTLDAPLVAGADAPLITVHVTVTPYAYASGVVNDAIVEWTDLESPTVYDDEDSVMTDLRWIHYTGSSECISDVPWFDYELTTSTNVDTTALPVTIEWYKDSDGNGIPEDPTSTESDSIVDDASAAPVAVYTIAAGASLLTTDDGREYPVTVTTAGLDRTLTGSALWPGADADAAGIGTAWPGWRIATPGETPTWENLVYDETLPGANLRAGALIVIRVNPTTAVTASYPPATPACTLPRLPELALEKTASVIDARAGDKFEYALAVTGDGLGATNDVVLVDDIPADLKVLDVIEDAPSDPTIPAWHDCTVALQDAHGFGGVVTCVLDGYLGVGQSAPIVTVQVELSAASKGETVVNHASLSWTDPDGQSPDGLVRATAVVNAGWLATTGVTLALGGLSVLTLLAAGGVLLFLARRRSKLAADEASW